MRYIKIDSRQRTVLEAFFDKGDVLPQMQKQVGGLIEPVHIKIENNDTLFVNEEGLFMGWRHGFYWHGLRLMGDGIICGFDPKTGDTVAVRSNPVDFLEDIHFFQVQEEQEAIK